MMPARIQGDPQFVASHWHWHWHRRVSASASHSVHWHPSGTLVIYLQCEHCPKVVP